VKYEILGPLRVVDEGGVSSLSARKIETLLTVLLIRADQVVSCDQLIEEIWCDDVPRRATAGLHVYVSQLRKWLDRPGRADSPVVTRPPGYLLRLGSDELDLHEFQRLSRQGRAYQAAGRPDLAAASLEAALALWRGAVPRDTTCGPVVDGFVTWLEESRLECLEALAEANLRLGRHRELVSRLYSLTTEYPLRESFYRQLMLALYRSERQADALMVYHSARETLHDELGLEPCRTLRELQQAILMEDDSLSALPAAM
jgi:SARP family transcriptional regulator, regulator of embCAB operon